MGRSEVEDCWCGRMPKSIPPLLKQVEDQLQCLSSAACIASAVSPYPGTQQERSGGSRANRNRKKELVALAEVKDGSTKVQDYKYIEIEVPSRS
jgi:hypothetical protein